MGLPASLPHTVFLSLWQGRNAKETFILCFILCDSHPMLALCDDAVPQFVLEMDRLLFFIYFSISIHAKSFLIIL